MTPYPQALADAMSEVAAAPNPIVLGQAVLYPGTAMFQTLSHLPSARRLELPVFEDTQLGVSIGLSLADPAATVLSVFPRAQFLLCAMNQLALHLNAIARYSDYRPRVLIRAAVPHDAPLDPGPQHLGDPTAGLELLLRDLAAPGPSPVDLVRLENVASVLPAYRRALASPRSTILVEYAHLYDAP